jgi:hypothetical protein
LHICILLTIIVPSLLSDILAVATRRISLSDAFNNDKIRQLTPTQHGNMIDRSGDSKRNMSGSLISDHLTPNELSTVSPQNQALLRSVAITTAVAADDQVSIASMEGDPRSLVGFECAYCASSPLVRVPSRLSNHLTRVFPISLDAMGASLQLLRDQHFVDEDQRCVLLPFAEEKIFDSPDPKNQDPTTSVQDLQSISEKVAQRIHIQNKVPGEKVGIVFEVSNATCQPSSSPSTLSKESCQEAQRLETFSTAKMDSVQGLLDFATRIDDSTKEDSYLNKKPPSFYQSNLPQKFNYEVSQWERLSALSSGYIEKEGRSSTERNSSLLASGHPSLFTSGRGINPYYFGSDGGVHAFIPDGTGWSCAYCCQIPFHLRAVGSYHPVAPSPEIQMQHLRMCTGLLRQGFPAAASVLYPKQLLRDSVMPPPNSLLPISNPARRPGTTSPAVLSTNSSQESDNDGALVLLEDRLLLTDYFYFINQQLRICKFTKDDRTKTRGGKRKFIELGFGGIACRHCHGREEARKFFWRNVDLLANSFSEICNHIQNCAYCPEEIKAAISERKSRHAEQMAKLPRGWQKVFFRRMWRRIHQDSEVNVEGIPSPPVPAAASADTENLERHTGTSPGNTSAVSTGKEYPKLPNSLPSSGVLAPTCSPGACLLAIPEDKQWLSDTDCFIRRCLEVFVATEYDVKEQECLSGYGRKGKVEIGQVGIRCIYCASSRQPGSAPLRKKAIIYPPCINDVYESVREIQKVHFATCPNTPDEERSKLVNLKTQSSLSSIVRRYYVIAAKALGLELYDTETGIRARARVGSDSGDQYVEQDSSNQKISP